MVEHRPKLSAPCLIRIECWSGWQNVGRWETAVIRRIFYSSWLISIGVGLLYIFCSSTPSPSVQKSIVLLIIFYPLLLFNILNLIPMLMHSIPNTALFFCIPDIIAIIWLFLTSSPNLYIIAVSWLGLPVWISLVMSVIYNFHATIDLAVYIALYIFYSCFCWRYVIRLPRWRVNRALVDVCIDCVTMLRRSGLIFGSRVLLTRVVEWHRIRLNSNPGCPLCMVLASSYDKIDSLEQDDQELLSSYGTFWSHTRPTRSAEEGDPLITAEHGTVMLKGIEPENTPTKGTRRIEISGRSNAKLHLLFLFLDWWKLPFCQNPPVLDSSQVVILNVKTCPNPHHRLAGAAYDPVAPVSEFSKNTRILGTC